MLIAHLSDTHINDEGKPAYGVAPTAENLVRCIEHINQLNPQPDIVLVTGDITYSGRREEAHYAARLLNKLRAPYCIVPGNHDERKSLQDVFSECAGNAAQGDFFSYVVEGYPVRFIGMDSSSPDGPGGEISTAQAAWLAEMLAKEQIQPTVIFMHHPPVRFGVPETDEDGFNDAQLLGDILDRYSNVLSIFCGHIHLAAHTDWHGTVVSTAPSMGLQLTLDLRLTGPSEFVLEAPGYCLHYYTPEKNLVTYTVFVRDVDGPYSFAGSEK